MPFAATTKRACPLSLLELVFEHIGVVDDDAVEHAVELLWVDARLAWFRLNAALRR